MENNIDYKCDLYDTVKVKILEHSFISLTSILMTPSSFFLPTDNMKPPNETIDSRGRRNENTDAANRILYFELPISQSPVNIIYNITLHVARLQYKLFIYYFLACCNKKSQLTFEWNQLDIRFSTTQMLVLKQLDNYYLLH